MSKTKQWPWMDRLNERLMENYFSSMNESSNTSSAWADVYMDDDSFIEVELFANNDVNVYYYHKDDSVERDCPNITSYIEDHLYGWTDLVQEYEEAEPEDEWDAHGFRDEADYWRYRLGS